MLEITCPVREQLSYSKKQLVKLSSNYEGLAMLGIDADSVVMEVKQATLGGFIYMPKLYITMPLIVNHMPVFAEIQTVLIYEGKIIVLIQKFTTVDYDSLFGAFVVEKDSQADMQALFVSSLLHQPLSSWERSDQPNLIYLSPRRSHVDQLFQANMENDLQ